jgi:hypothetical protein
MSRRSAISLAGAKSLRTVLPEGLAVPKRSKYRNVPTVYAGVRYDSKGEATRARELDTAAQVGLIRFWVRQPTFRLGVPENIYRADFLVVGLDDVWVEDVKGAETAKFRRDKKLWAAYGPCRLVVVRGGVGTEIIPGGRS